MVSTRGAAVTSMLLVVGVLTVACASSDDTTGTTSPPSTVSPVTSAPTASAAPEAEEQVLFDFSDPLAVADWRNQDDVVMGGLSQSTGRADDGALVFAGTISLENDGGFASILSSDDPELGRLADGASALQVHARGDGKTYVAQVRTAGRPYTYIQRFTTGSGIDEVIDLPVADFEPVTFMLTPAVDAPPTLDPASITQFGFYILDKQDGPFELRINRIVAASNP